MPASPSRRTNPSDAAAERAKPALVRAMKLAVTRRAPRPRTLAPLASIALFCTLLASKPVYAFAPPSSPAPAAAAPAKTPATKTPEAKPTTTAKPPATTPSDTAARGGADAKAKRTSAAGKDPKRKGGRKSTVIDDDFLIEGKLEKPSAFYVLRRSSVDFDWARLDATFSPLVLESVQDPLF